MKKWSNGLRLALCIGLMSSSLAVQANDLSEQQMSQMTYQGKPITLEFQEIPVRAALDVLARFSGQNIVVDDSVSGNITLRLTNVPWDQVLDMIAQSQSLSIINQDGIMFISTKTLQARKMSLMLSCRFVLPSCLTQTNWQIAAHFFKTPSAP